MGAGVSVELNELSQRTGFSISELRFFNERFHQLDQSPTHEATFLADSDFESMRDTAPFARKLCNLYPNGKVTFEQRWGSFGNVSTFGESVIENCRRAAAIFSMLFFQPVSPTGNPPPPLLGFGDLSSDALLAFGPNANLAEDVRRAIYAVNTLTPPTMPANQPRPSSPSGISLAQFTHFLATRCPPFSLPPLPPNLMGGPPPPADTSAGSNSQPPPAGAPSLPVSTQQQAGQTLQPPRGPSPSGSGAFRGNPEQQPPTHSAGSVDVTLPGSRGTESAVGSTPVRRSRPMPISGTASSATGGSAAQRRLSSRLTVASTGAPPPPLLPPPPPSPPPTPPPSMPVTSNIVPASVRTTRQPPPPPPPPPPTPPYEPNGRVAGTLRRASVDTTRE